MKINCAGGHWKQWLTYGLGGALGLLLISLLPLVAAPALKIKLLSTNQLEITITNAQPGEAFEIQRRLAFNSNYPWGSPLLGTPGQTSFIAEIGIDWQGFFRALGCLDCDMDGVSNWMDGDPFSTNVGKLSITIISPTNGSTLN